MRFEIVTIFPGFFTSILEHGILRRALAENLIEVGVHDLRAFTHDRHRTVDDRPFGGGEGMVLKPGPLAEALVALGIEPKTERQILSGAEAPAHNGAISARLKSCPDTEHPDSDLGSSGGGETPARQPSQGRTSVVPQTQQDEAGALAPEGSHTRVILLSAQGRPFTQAAARELAGLDRIVLICGRYEGVDERINQLYCDLELSIGDYVLSGGELAAAVVVDAVMRLVPGVLGNEASGEFESFGVADAEIAADTERVPRSQHGSGGLLDYPHYTRPAEFAGLRAPEVLLNGDHQQIRRWRREQQLRKTLANRPDLLERANLSNEDRKLLDAIRQEGAFD
ncbi:MAG: tRNA (guanosine(37)-N1)-methyltransferase TrmD [Terracidiphilus sp.]|jgi:tRNA (guanine37-N1)-methyltransferase